MSFHRILMVIVAINKFDAFEPIQGIFANIVSTDLKDSLG